MPVFLHHPTAHSASAGNRESIENDVNAGDLQRWSDAHWHAPYSPLVFHSARKQPKQKTAQQYTFMGWRQLFSLQYLSP